MACRRLNLDNGIGSHVHRLFCGECRGAAEQDASLALAVECMQAEPVPAGALERTLDSLGLPRPVGGVLVQERRRPRSMRLRWTWAGTLLAFVVLWFWWLNLDPEWLPLSASGPPAVNGFSVLEQAAAQAHPFIVGVDTAAMKDPREGLAEKRRGVEATKDFRRRAREAFRMPYGEPPGTSPSQTFPYYAYFLELARQFVWEGDVHAADGRTDAAWWSYQDALEFSIVTGNSATLIGRLVSYSTAELAYSRLMPLVGRLSRAQARQAAKDLENLARRRTPLGVVLQRHTEMDSAVLRDLLSDPWWRFRAGNYYLLALSDSAASDESPSAIQRLAFFLRLAPYSDCAIYSNYLSAMFSQISMADSYPLPPATDEAARPAVYGDGWKPYDRQKLDPVSATLLVELGPIVRRDAVDRASLSLLTAAAGVRAYWAEKGAPPRALQDLVDSGCLKVVPQDPFRPPRQPVSYRVSRRRAVLYCYGADLVDNLGTPVPGWGQYGDRRLNATSNDQTGDLVITLGARE